jgi:hypothetical protein
MLNQHFTYKNVESNIFLKKIINIFFSTFFLNFLQPPSNSHGSTRDGHGAWRLGPSRRPPCRRTGALQARAGGRHGALAHSGVGPAAALGGRGARWRQLRDGRDWAPEEEVEEDDG